MKLRNLVFNGLTLTAVLLTTSAMAAIDPNLSPYHGIVVDRNDCPANKVGAHRATPTAFGDQQMAHRQSRQTPKQNLGGQGSRRVRTGL